MYSGTCIVQNTYSCVLIYYVLSSVAFLQTAPKIFGGKIMTHLLLFVSKKSDKFEEVLASVKDSSKKFKGKVSTRYYSVKLQLLMFWSFLHRSCLCWWIVMLKKIPGSLNSLD